MLKFPPFLLLFPWQDIKIQLLLLLLYPPLVLRVLCVPAISFGLCCHECEHQRHLAGDYFVVTLALFHVTHCRILHFHLKNKFRFLLYVSEAVCVKKPWPPTFRKSLPEPLLFTRLAHVTMHTFADKQFKLECSPLSFTFYSEALKAWIHFNKFIVSEMTTRLVHG